MIRISLLTGCLAAFTVLASAQDRPSLRVPTIVFLSAAGADKLSTVYNISQGTHLMTFADGSQRTVSSREVNPMYSWAPNPGVQMAVSAAADTLGLLGLRRLGRRHPKLATLALYAWAGARATATVGNISAGRQHRDYKRKAVSISILR